MSYLKLFSSIALVMFLGACVSLSTIRTMQVMSGFSPFDDDIANMVFGIEASPVLQAQAETSTFSMTVEAAGNGPSVHKFALEKADASELSITGVPQNRNKILSLFKFTEKSKVEIVEFQALLRDMRAKKTQGGSLSIGIEPDFCKTKEIDNARERFSAYLAQGGKGDLMPVIDNMTLKDLLKKTKRKLVRDC